MTMKRVPLLPITAFVALTILALPAALAQDGQGTGAADEEAIRALEEQVRLGVLNQDLESLTSVWSENFMVNNPANRVSPNRAFVFDLIRAGRIHYTSFESRIEALRVDGDLAIVMGAETVVPTGQAPHAGQTVERRFTHVWQRHGDTWLLAARHANELPLP